MNLWFILAYVWTSAIFLFILGRKKILDMYLTNKANMIKDREALIIEREMLQTHIEQMTKENEILKERNRIPYDAEIEAQREKNNIELMRLATVEKDLSNQLKALMLPHEAELQALKYKAEAAERIAEAEINKAERLAEIEVARAKELAEVETLKTIDTSLADFENYKNAKTQEVLAEIRVKEHKIETNKKYVSEFLRQEDYNGKYDEFYTIKSPKPPYAL